MYVFKGQIFGAGGAIIQKKNREKRRKERKEKRRKERGKKREKRKLSDNISRINSLNFAKSDKNRQKSKDIFGLVS